MKKIKLDHINLTPKNCALLIIDVTNFCADKKCEIKKWNITYTKIRKMVPKLVNFISVFKKKFGAPVIYVNCTKWQKDHLAPNIVELYKDPKARYYSTDLTGFSEDFYLVKPEKNDLIITKNHYDAFTNPKLDNFLKKKKIKCVIVTGIFGDGCVHATINGGFSKGYNFIILKDLIETTDDKNRQELQSLLAKFTWPLMFGKTITSSKLLKLIK